MIVDTLESANKYTVLHTHFARAFQFLRDPGLATMPEGKVEILPGEIFAIISEQLGKEKSDAFLEAHRQYIDIQFLLNGKETLGWKALSDCTSIRDGYDNEKDIVFFADAPTTFVNLLSGQFCVFFPEDAHAPMISAGMVKKVVIKIKI